MNDSSEWVSLHEAAEILGVHPATVRNWADKGDLVFRRTPGGHRRFRRADLSQYAQKQGELQPLEVQFILQNALGHARMHIGDGSLTQIGWYESLDETIRDQMRRQGRLVLEALRAYIAQNAAPDQLSTAATLGQNYAQMLMEKQIKLNTAVKGFFYFTDFVIDSIVTWSEINTPHNSSEWVSLLRKVNTFTNTILLSIIEFYEAR